MRGFPNMRDNQGTALPASDPLHARFLETSPAGRGQRTTVMHRKLVILASAAAAVLLCGAAPARADEWTATDISVTSGSPGHDQYGTADYVGVGYSYWRGGTCWGSADGQGNPMSEGGTLVVSRVYTKTGSPANLDVWIGGQVDASAYCTYGSMGSGSYVTSRATADGDSGDFPNTDELDKQVAATYPSNPNPSAESDNMNAYSSNDRKRTLSLSDVLSGTAYFSVVGSGNLGAGGAGEATSFISLTSP